MTIQFINVESFLFLRKFIGPTKPLMSNIVLPVLCFYDGAQKKAAK